MAAHLSKIHGLDWHPDNEFILATSSQDNSVRVRTTDGLKRSTDPNISFLFGGAVLTVVVVCSVLGFPTAQEVPEHPVLSGPGVEGPVHGEHEHLSSDSC